MRTFLTVLVALTGLSCQAADVPTATPAAAAETYLLRYKFAPNQVLRWQVDHRFEIRTSVGGTTKTAETSTSSTKVWRVHDINAKGQITFDYLVESVNMRHRLSGSNEAHYDSKTDFPPGKGFEDVARAVGIPLAIVTIDNRGKVIDRVQNPVKSAIPSQGEVTIPLPEDAVTVGKKWTFSHPIDVTMPNGTNHRVMALQMFELKGVQTGVATIAMATKIISPISDPALEARVLQYETTGTVRFDIDAGQVLGQKLDLDKGALGFGGQASSIHYLGRTSEDLLAGAAEVHDVKQIANGQWTMDNGQR